LTGGKDGGQESDVAGWSAGVKEVTTTLQTTVDVESVEDIGVERAGGVMVSEMMEDSCTGAEQSTKNEELA
jgi:hypothetical protein